MGFWIDYELKVRAASTGIWANGLGPGVYSIMHKGANNNVFRIVLINTRIGNLCYYYGV